MRGLGRRGAATATALVLGVGALGAGAMSGPAAASGRVVSAAAQQAGGVVTFLQYRSSEHYDPQRVYIGRDLANLGRLVYRSLVAFPTSTDPARANKPVPDLATNTGVRNQNATVWKFTLKAGVRWQDGKSVTCGDLKYGVSRVFATDVITGGPNYVLGYLDIPTNHKTGLPIYTGPYRHTAAGQAAFDKAITCHGRTITYHFKKPWPDLPQAMAGLDMFDPFRADQDYGDKSNLRIFSDGPYQVQGKVNAEKGFTLVRNAAWDPKTDKIRKAYPDKFKFQIGTDPDTQYEQLISDSLPNAITTSSVPPADYSQITGSVRDRSVLVNSPFNDYALPNFNSQVMKNPKVRLALAQATSRTGWNNALGGAKASKPAYSVVNPSVPGYRKNPTFVQVPLAGEPGKARATLRSSGLKLPVPIKFTYPGGTPETENAAAALKQVWDKAGFRVTLNELPDTYYTVVQNPQFKSDVVYGGWGADWPSIGTVIPPLFDSRINLTRYSNGQDYGNFASKAVNRAIDKVDRNVNLGRANAAWAKIDAMLGRQVAYIPLDIPQFYYLRGSNIDGYVNSLGTSSYPDLATISLKQP